MNAGAEVSKLLKESGAILKRDKKHEVWQLPNGNNFIRAKTPSDSNEALNNLTDLKRALGISAPDRGQPGERRAHKHKPGRMGISHAAKIEAPIIASLQDKLRGSGAVELGLRSTIWMLRREITRNQVANLRKRKRLQREAVERGHCWWCRVKRAARILIARIWNRRRVA